jgi:hypothetical protein
MRSMSRFIALLVVVSAGLPAAVEAAGRTRAVRKPPAGAPIVSPSPQPQQPVVLFTLQGTVVDSITKRPVERAEISVLGRSGVRQTDAAGKFSMQIASGLSVTLVLERPGYETTRADVGPVTADFNRQIEMKSRPTVKVRMKDGTIHEVDLERVEFGYVVAFAGYNKNRKANMCKISDGTQFLPDREEIKRIVGPGVSTRSPACCPNNNVQTFSVELKNGEKHTAAFADTCYGYNVDLISTDHVTAQGIFLKFNEIVEVTFP